MVLLRVTISTIRVILVQWNPALQTLVNTDTRLLRTVLFVPATHIFSYISPLNTDTWIIRTLFHVPQGGDNKIRTLNKKFRYKKDGTSHISGVKYNLSTLAVMAQCGGLQVPCKLNMLQNLLQPK